MITHITVEEAAKLISRLTNANETQALTYIREAADRGEIQGADALEKLQAELKQVKRERDAAVEGLRVCSIENNKECQYCLYRTARSFCWNCTDVQTGSFAARRRADNEEDDNKGVREIVAR